MDSGEWEILSQQEIDALLRSLSEESEAAGEPGDHAPAAAERRDAVTLLARAVFQGLAGLVGQTWQDDPVMVEEAAELATAGGTTPGTWWEFSWQEPDGQAGVGWLWAPVERDQGQAVRDAVAAGLAEVGLAARDAVTARVLDGPPESREDTVAGRWRSLAWFVPSTVAGRLPGRLRPAGEPAAGAAGVQVQPAVAGAGTGTPEAVPGGSAASAQPAGKARAHAQQAAAAEPVPSTEVGGAAAGMDGGGPLPFQPLRSAPPGGAGLADGGTLDLLLDVPLQLTVELGQAQRTVGEILEMAPGTVVELDKLAGEPVDLLVNGRLIARGEVVVIDENFGIRITDIVSPSERLRRLR